MMICPLLYHQRLLPPPGHSCRVAAASKSPEPILLELSDASCHKWRERGQDYKNGKELYIQASGEGTTRKIHALKLNWMLTSYHAEKLTENGP